VAQVGKVRESREVHCVPSAAGATERNWPLGDLGRDATALSAIWAGTQLPARRLDGRMKK
ncbi:MAG TPA: hypothetical protein VFE07_07600, partial [Marmoricola sp.]|nr:hypothetical protein [Marmoricola sp.]